MPASVPPVPTAQANESILTLGLIPNLFSSGVIVHPIVGFIFKLIHVNAALLFGDFGSNEFDNFSDQDMAPPVQP
jgi:hypothetical protein